MLNSIGQERKLVTSADWNWQEFVPRLVVGKRMG
ncbi:hypothetical protein BWQ96_03033 [Gracilariopsis chorda]|uniref:Uncharacterized protein n=1 Tax=Gracilariopsis chorda TaxID=448386 RepID=A0A2V3IYN4_9FLOR|nr:hypothetical protein BWQ96_03033 [Gracilariopsis chorda]|eukprot:PXF47258.1 hypothetical protein BWQ96_03033 [Gracilariopsis chorda]